MRKLSLLAMMLGVLFGAAQTNQYQYGTDDHQKEVIGYFTNWDAWKAAPHDVNKGFYNQLNIDYSQYTMLNWSFLGLAEDGSLHSGDLRNPLIHQAGQNQAPGPMFFDDIYSSWDYWLLYGELEVLHYVPDNIEQSPSHPLYWVFTDHDITGNGAGWINTVTGESGDYPLSLPKPNGAKGLMELCHDNDVDLMASIGGWSMSKHFPEVAADPVKRAKFVQDCVTLIDMGFDGIDIDWEFPGPFSGMNFVGTNADYTNFAILMEDIRAAIGPDKLITAAFNTSPSKLSGFDWARISQSMDYFNIMSYDMHGGWSDLAGHNSPLYPSPGAFAGNESWDTTFTYLQSQGVNPAQINMGVGFYGRGVNTDGPASLNAPTVKVPKNIQPDGPVMTAGDFDNWGPFDATPFYNFIEDNKAGWTYQWDDTAKVPYLTNGDHFVSYDNIQSMELKADYVKSNNIGGVIVWQVFGDIDPGPIVQTYANKLPYAPDSKAPLVNSINRRFADGTIVNVNQAPEVTINGVTDGALISQDTLRPISISVQIVDVDGLVASTEFKVNDVVVNFIENNGAYEYAFTAADYGIQTLEVTATDDAGAITNSTLQFTIEEVIDVDFNGLDATTWDALFPYRYGGTLQGNGSYDITDDFYSYANFATALQRMSNIEVTFERKCATNLYKITRRNKSTGATIVIREDAGFSTNSDASIVDVVDYAAFAKAGTQETQLRELMAFLANISQETTGGWATAPGGQYAWGLHFNEEQGYAGTSNVGYVDAGNSQYPAVAGKSYHGRGPIQLSWNYNYGQVSEFLFGDKNVLLNNPEMVVNDGALAFQTAIWFWMTPQYPKPSAHAVMVGDWTPTAQQENAGLIPGFGATVNIINGGIECNSGTENAKVLGRIGHYDKFTDIVGIGMALDGSDTVVELGCANMPAFQIDFQECGQASSIAFTQPLDNATIALNIGESVPVNLALTDPNVTISNPVITIEGIDYTGTAASWIPSSFGTYVLTATAIDGGDTLNATINVTIIDAAQATGCEGVAAYDPNAIYDVAGQRVVLNSKIYENKWWTQNEDPSSSQVWEFVQDCGNTTVNNAPIITVNTPSVDQIFSQELTVPVTIDFTAVDTDGTLSAVQATIDGVGITLTQTGDRFTADFIASAAGSFVLEITATDDLNEVTTVTQMFAIEEILIENQAPVISNIVPVSGQVLTQNSLQPITITATVTDADADLETVVFNINGTDYFPTPAAVDTFAFDYTPAQYGVVSITYIATDATGLVDSFNSSFEIIAPQTGDTCGYDSWSSQVYDVPGTQVYYNGIIYQNQWYAEATEIPGVDMVWSQIETCGAGPDLSATCGFETWSSTTVYEVAGITVYFNGELYISKWWTQGEQPDTSISWDYVSECTVINQNSQKSETSIAPNPVVDMLIVHSDKAVDQINVFDFAGQQRLTITGHEGYAGNLLSGNVYVAQIRFADGTTEAIKFVKD